MLITLIWQLCICFANAMQNAFCVMQSSSERLMFVGSARHCMQRLGEQRNVGEWEQQKQAEVNSWEHMKSKVDYKTDSLALIILITRIRSFRALEMFVTNFCMQRAAVCASCLLWSEAEVRPFSWSVAPSLSRRRSVFCFPLYALNTETVLIRVLSFSEILAPYCRQSLIVGGFVDTIMLYSAISERNHISRKVSEKAIDHARRLS